MKGDVKKVKEWEQRRMKKRCKRRRHGNEWKREEKEGDIKWNKKVYQSKSENKKELKAKTK